MGWLLKYYINYVIVGGNTGKKNKSYYWDGVNMWSCGQLYSFGDANNTGNILNNIWKYDVVEKRNGQNNEMYIKKSNILPIDDAMGTQKNSEHNQMILKPFTHIL